MLVGCDGNFRYLILSLSSPQGYVEIKEVPLDLQDAEGLSQSPDGNPSALGLPSFYTIILISRRSRHRAGKSPLIEIHSRPGESLIYESGILKL